MKIFAVYSIKLQMAAVKSFKGKSSKGVQYSNTGLMQV